MRPTTSIQKDSEGFHELRLRGAFEHPHWMAHLLSNLSEAHVSVVSGQACQMEDSCWDARLTLDFRSSTATPEVLDFVAMAQRRSAAVDWSPPQVSQFLITRRRDQQIELLVEGPDQIGFLSRLLTKVSVLGLFPSELEINTVAGQIRDRLVLRGITAMGPTRTVQSALEAVFRLMRSSTPASPEVLRTAGSGTRGVPARDARDDHRLR